MMTVLDAGKVFLCVAAWKEARGEADPHLSMRAVMHAIVNSARLRKMELVDQILYPLYISSLTAPADGQLTKWPKANDPLFGFCLSVVDAVVDGTDEDPTEGATNYFNPHIVLPNWAAKMVKIKDIGNHAFYRA